MDQPAFVRRPANDDTKISVLRDDRQATQDR